MTKPSVAPPPGWDVFEVLWHREHFLHCREHYGLMVQVLTRHVHFAAELCRLIEVERPSEVEAFASSLLRMWTPQGGPCLLIKTLLEREFLRYTDETKGSIMRGKGVVVQLQRSHLRSVGRTYVQSILGPLVARVLDDSKLDLEVNPTRIALVEGKQEERLRTNQLALEAICQEFVDTITGDTSLHTLPREIRAVAFYIGECAQRIFPDQHSSLLGGYLLLRFICPVLVSPESWLPSLQASPRARRNLILISKVLQNLANGLLFGSKEAYLIPLNDLLESNMKRMREFLLQSATDPIVHAHGPWQDVERLNPTINVDSLDIGVLFHLHSYIDATSRRLVSFITEQQARAASTDSEKEQAVFSADSCSQITAMVLALGPVPGVAVCGAPSVPLAAGAKVPSPRRSATSGVQDSAKVKAPVVTPGGRLRSTSAGSNDDAIARRDSRLGSGEEATDHLDRTRKHLTSHTWETGLGRPTFASSLSGGECRSINNASFRKHLQLPTRAQFLYKGLNNTSGFPVFYLIVARIELEFLQDIEALLHHTLQVMDASASSGYALVVDMSWAQLSLELQRFLYSNISDFYAKFTRSYKKNLKAVYIVHPTAFTRATLYLVQTFASRKVKNKIYELYHWEDLQQYILPAHILLPETSKDFITKSYSVCKVNARGKSQRRLIKFTSHSLLNIDPKYNTIQNEKDLGDIEELRVPIDSTELQMSFVAGGDKHKRGGLFGRMKATRPQDSVFRRYVCRSKEERDHVVQDIFRTGFRRSALGAKQQEFYVWKFDGKVQSARILKLTVDSLLLMDAKFRIKSETSFAGIANVSPDPAHPSGICLTFRPDSRRKRMICGKGERDAVISEIKLGMERYTLAEEEARATLKSEVEHRKEVMQRKLRLLREEI